MNFVYNNFIIHPSAYPFSPEIFLSFLKTIHHALGVKTNLLIFKKDFSLKYHRFFMVRGRMLFLLNCITYQQTFGKNKEAYNECYVLKLRFEL